MSDLLASGGGLPAFAVVVVNYRSSELLQQFLVPVTKATGVRVVIVDNFSDEVERDNVQLLAAAQGWDILLAENRGFGAGVNEGVRWASKVGAKAVLVMNPDLQADGRTIQQLLEHAAASPTSVVVPASRRPNGAAAHGEGTLDMIRGLTRTSIPTPGAQRWLSGACFAMSMDLWKKLDGLDEDYFMYWEDVDLSYRADRLGYRLIQRSDLVVVHQVGGTQGTRKSPLYYHYNCRNRLLFAEKHLTGRDQFRWVLQAPSYAARVLTREGRRRVLRQPRTTLIPAVSGTFAGVRSLVRRYLEEGR